MIKGPGLDPCHEGSIWRDPRSIEGRVGERGGVCGQRFFAPQEEEIGQGCIVVGSLGVDSDLPINAYRKQINLTTQKNYICE